MKIVRRVWLRGVLRRYAAKTSPETAVQSLSVGARLLLVVTVTDVRL